MSRIVDLSWLSVLRLGVELFQVAVDLACGHDRILRVDAAAVNVTRRTLAKASAPTDGPVHEPVAGIDP